MGQQPSQPLTQTPTVKDPVSNPFFLLFSDLFKNPILTEQSVIDQKQQIINSYKNQPYKCIGRVIVGYLDQKSQNQINLPYGTGFLIHPRIVLTSAHNIHNRESKKLPDQIFFIIESDKQGDDNIIKVERYAIHQDYFNNYVSISNKYDIAILILQQSKLIKPDMCLKIQYNSQINLKNQQNYMISGYPKIPNQNVPKILQWKFQIEITKFYENMIFYKHNTSNGYSGSPIIKIQFTQNGPQYIAIGAHKCQTASGEGCAILFNAEVKQLFSFLQNLQQNPIKNAQSNAQKMKLRDFLNILNKRNSIIFQNQLFSSLQYVPMQRILWSKQLNRKFSLKQFIRSDTNQNSYLNFFNRLQNILDHKLPKEQKYMILDLNTWKFIFKRFKILKLSQKQTEQLFQVFLQLIQLNKGNKIDINQTNEIQKIATKLYRFQCQKNHRNKSNNVDFNDNLSQNVKKLRNKIQTNFNQNINKLIYTKRLKQQNLRLMTFYKNYNQLQKALQFAKQPYDKGLILLQLKQYKTALKYFFDYLQYASLNNGSKQDLANAKFSIARTYQQLQCYEDAIEYYQQCLEIDKQIKGVLSDQYTYTANNIAKVYQAKKNYERALQYLQWSLYLKTKIYSKKSNATIVISLFNIAETYKKWQKYDKALEKYRQVLQITEDKAYKEICRQNIVQSYHIYYSIGLVYKQLNEFDQALQNLLLCIKLVQMISGRKAKQNLIKTYWTVSILYKQKNRIQQAKQYMRKSYEVSLELLTYNNPSTKKLKNQYDQLQKLCAKQRQ